MRSKEKRGASETLRHSTGLAVEGRSPESGARNPEPESSAWWSPRFYVLLTLLALLTAAGLLGLDRIVAQAVDQHEPGWLLMTSKVISLLGGIGIYPLTACVLLFTAWWFRPDRWLWRTCLWILTAEAVCALLVRVLKIGFGRWRPDQVLGGQFDYFQFKSKCHSFPSGHTADAVVVATVLWFAYPRLRPLCVAAALLMAAARIGAAQHFVADAATGAILGILCALAMQRKLGAIERWIERKYALGPEDTGLGTCRT